MRNPLSHIFVPSPIGEMRNPLSHIVVPSPIDKMRNTLLHIFVPSPIGKMRNPLSHIFVPSPIGEMRNPLSHIFVPSPIGEMRNPLTHIFVPSPIGEINLHPIDALHDDLKAMNNDKDFNPAPLNLASTDSVLPLFYSYMKKIAETSNNNLIRNSNAFLASGGKIDPASKFEWIDSSMEETQKKFQMSY